MGAMWLWTGDENRRSPRYLVAHFGQSPLWSAVQAEGVQILNGEMENFYRLRTDEKVLAPTRLGYEGVSSEIVTISTRCWITSLRTG